MTREDVVEAKQALEAQGVSPSLRAILAHLGRGSKRDVARLLRELARERNEATPASVDDDPAPEPPPPDPVSLATSRVEHAQAQLDAIQSALAASTTELAQVREQLLLATMRFAATQGVLVQGIRVGGLMPADGAKGELQREVDAAEHAYRQAWIACQSQQEHLEQARVALRQAQQEHSIAVHHPELAAELARCEQALAAVDKDDERGRYVARHQLMQARHRYALALREAPGDAA